MYAFKIIIINKSTGISSIYYSMLVSRSLNSTDVPFDVWLGGMLYAVAASAAHFRTSYRGQTVIQDIQRRIVFAQTAILLRITTSPLL